MKDDVLKLRISSERKQSWRESANRAGLTLSQFIERCVEEARDLERALELQAEEARRERERRTREAQHFVAPSMPRRPESAKGLRPRTTIGDVLDAADARAR
jgi:hypothetical protein